MLKLIYQGEEFYARTWTAFTDRWNKLNAWNNVVYNNKLNYKCDTFEISRITIIKKAKGNEKEKGN